ncbi:hypothetical protein JCM1841_005806 [Sporobolomyces salmonicolor]
MARDPVQQPISAANGIASTSTAANGVAGASGPAPGGVGGTAAAGGSGATSNKRVALADRDLHMLSLPSQDLPMYYDSPDSDGFDSDSADHCSFPLSRSHTARPLTSNRGNKLAPSAPFTRISKLGHHAHVDAGFHDPLLDGPSSLAGPASRMQKRRKLNDLAPTSSTNGFPVAPNLHLVPRPLIAGEPDSPFPSFLPPVPQSPLDLVLLPSMQHTLGPKNPTFMLLGQSTTGLIEQEQELVAALSGVCRGLRGEGFEWRWEGDEERRRERDEQRRKFEEEEAKKEEEEEAEASRRREEEDEKARQEAERVQQLQQREQEQAMEVDQRQPHYLPSAEEHPTPVDSNASFEASGVKPEPETPVLQAAVAPGIAAAQAASVSAAERTTPAPVANGEGQEMGAEQEPGSGRDVEMAPVDEPASTSTISTNEHVSAAPPSVIGPSGPPPAIDENVSTLALPALPDPASTSSDAAAPQPVATSADVPVPSVVAEHSTNGAAEPTSAAESKSPSDQTPQPRGNGPADGALAAPLSTATPANDEQQRPASPNPAGYGTPAPPAEPATPALDGADADPSASQPPGNNPEEDEPSLRRRSGRVASRATVPHTRSRNSSPEGGGDYLSGSEDEALGVDSSEDEPLARRAEGGGKRKRVAEEDLPEYAARLVDPELYVRSLFVSEGQVELEKCVQGPQGLVGTGQMESLSPNEQEALMHDCLTDLHRFLADTLEYRARLGEIRDGVLGVERRRKGMWKVVRTVAMDWLEEEAAGAGVDTHAGGGFE